MNIDDIYTPSLSQRGTRLSVWVSGAVLAVLFLVFIQLEAYYPAVYASWVIAINAVTITATIFLGCAFMRRLATLGHSYWWLLLAIIPGGILVGTLILGTLKADGE